MTEANGRPIIQLQGVNKYFGSFQALRNINLEVNKGEKIVVCGPSGSGKSTMIRCINRLEEHDSGSSRRQYLGELIGHWTAKKIGRARPPQCHELVLSKSDATLREQVRG